jgi:hypothetical protein
LGRSKEWFAFLTCGIYTTVSEPFRIKCTLSEVPSAATLDALSNDKHHVVLCLPVTLGSSEKSALVQRLTEALPEHSVFDAGAGAEATHVTVLRPIASEIVLAHADDVIAAAFAFRVLASNLARRLAAHLNVSPELLANCFGEGSLDDVWDYVFHGRECRFENRRGQILDVRLSFGTEFGVLDPWFFSEFLCTTARWHALSVVFRDKFHDTRRSFDILARIGRLQSVQGNVFDIGLTGYIAPGDINASPIHSERIGEDA